MKPKLFWIPGPWRGKLAVASRPRGGDWLEDEIKAWQQAGFDVIVSLLEKDEAAQFELGQEGDVAESKGSSLCFVRNSRSGSARIDTGGAFFVRRDCSRTGSGQERCGALPARRRTFGAHRRRGAAYVGDGRGQRVGGSEHRTWRNHSRDTGAASMD